MAYPGIEIKVELIVLSEYLSQMETGIKAACDSYLKAEEEKITDEEFHEYKHIYDIAEDEIPRIIRLPIIVSIYTLYENSVMKLLDFAQEKEGKCLGLKDINGKSITSKFNKYMTHVLNYDFEFDNECMQNISIINKIRNNIAHTNGNIDSISKDKLNEIKKVEKMKAGVSISGNQLDISYDFINFSFLALSTAIKDLMAYMETRYDYN